MHDINHWLSHRLYELSLRFLHFGNKFFLFIKRNNNNNSNSNNNIVIIVIVNNIIIIANKRQDGEHIIGKM